MKNWIKLFVILMAILATGPTGSGKTSTLYTVLSELNKLMQYYHYKSVEFKISGINQYK